MSSFHLVVSWYIVVQSSRDVSLQNYPAIPRCISGEVDAVGWWTVIVKYISLYSYIMNVTWCVEYITVVESGLLKTWWPSCEETIPDLKRRVVRWYYLGARVLTRVRKDIVFHGATVSPTMSKQWVVIKRQAQIQPYLDASQRTYMICIATLHCWDQGIVIRTPSTNEK